MWDSHSWLCPVPIPILGKTPDSQEWLTYLR
jgi:hypothetical protein